MTVSQRFLPSPPRLAGRSWEDVAPELHRHLERIGGITFGNSIHGSLGSLGADDHTQYIRVDGTREFTGDQDMGGNSLIGVEALSLDPSPTAVPTAPASVYWDDGNDSLAVVGNAATQLVSIHNYLTGRDTADAHPASAITFTPYSTIAATDVQAAIQEVFDEGGGGGGAPTTAKYLVGALDAGLSAEVVKASIYDNYDLNDYPISPNAMDDEFEGGGGVDGKWTKVNDPAGGDALNQTSSLGFLTVGLAENAGTDNYAATTRLFQAPPTGSDAWTMIARLAISAVLASESSESASVLLYLADSANDEFVGAGPYITNTHWSATWLTQIVAHVVNGASGVFSSPATETGNLCAPILASSFVWVKFEKATANAYTSVNTYNTYISLNEGVLWQQVGTTAKTFTGACDEVGILFRSPKNQTGTAKAYGAVDSFRRIV